MHVSFANQGETNGTLCVSFLAAIKETGKYTQAYKKNLPKRRPTANNINADEQLIIDLMKK